jgi:hypothetical protein
MILILILVLRGLALILSAELLLPDPTSHGEVELKQLLLARSQVVSDVAPEHFLLPFGQNNTTLCGDIGIFTKLLLLLQLQ